MSQSFIDDFQQFKYNLPFGLPFSLGSEELLYIFALGASSASFQLAVICFSLRWTLGFSQALNDASQGPEGFCKQRFTSQRAYKRGRPLSNSLACMRKWGLLDCWANEDWKLVKWNFEITLGKRWAWWEVQNDALVKRIVYLTFGSATSVAE